MSKSELDKEREAIIDIVMASMKKAKMVWRRGGSTKNQMSAAILSDRKRIVKAIEERMDGTK